MQVFEKPAEKPGNRGNLLMLVDGPLKADWLLDIPMYFVY
jgi:hypothetical protein